MAFEKNYIALTQQEYPNAYFKIAQIFISYIQATATISVFGYKDENAANSNAQPIFQQDYPVSDQDFLNTFSVDQLAKKDPVTSAYGYLATLNDYNQAASKDIKL